MSTSASSLRLRDLKLQLTEHKRSLVDGSVITDPPLSEDAELMQRVHYHVACRFIVPVRGVSAVSVKTTDRATMLEIKRKLLEQLHELPEPQRPPDSVIASCGSRYFQRQQLQNNFRANIATDPEQLLFFIDEQDECLPDEATFYDLGYDASGPPLVSVYCATDHLWLRLRGFPERFLIPWYLHMTEVELAKEVYGVLQPADMRLVRAVFYRDEEVQRKNRKWRRPATEAPPMWRGGGHFGVYETEENTDQFSAAATRANQHQYQQPVTTGVRENNNKDEPQAGGGAASGASPQSSALAQNIRFGSASSSLNEAEEQKQQATTTATPPTGGSASAAIKALRLQQQQEEEQLQQQQSSRLNSTSRKHSAATAPAPLTPVILPLHEWCRVPPPPSTKQNPALTFELLRRRAAQLRADLVHEAFSQARDSWFELPDDLLPFADASLAIEHVPKTVEFVRSREGRSYVFRVELQWMRGGAATQETQEPLGSFAEAVLSECARMRPHEDATARSGGGGSGGRGRSPPLNDGSNNNNSTNNNIYDITASNAAASTSGETAVSAATDENSSSSSTTNFQVELLSWTPHLVATGNVAPDTGEAETVPFTHPQLYLPFDDDDEEISPFGRKQIHSLWSASEMISRYPFLDSDFFFHKRRESATSEEIVEMLRRQVKLFFSESLRYTFNLVDSSSGSSSSSSAASAANNNASQPLPVEFDHVSLPTHLSDHGICNGAEIFVELFSIHAQRWSGDIAQFAHDRMRENDDSDADARAAAAARQRRREIQQRYAQYFADDDEEEEEMRRRRNVPASWENVAASSFGGAVAGIPPQPNDDDLTPQHQRFSPARQQQQQQLMQRQREKDRQDYLAQRRKRNEIQLSKRQREAAVLEAGFHFVNVRTYRNFLLRVPVIFGGATVEDLLELVFCATGDLPMFSIVLGPQGDLVAPWAKLKTIESNPGLLNLRVLRRPRAWCQETTETVARRARNKAPHLD